MTMCGATTQETAKKKGGRLTPDQCPLVAVTPGQLSLLVALRGFRAELGTWPTSWQLATAADVAKPAAWADLKSLERLGCVTWRKFVELTRWPDGVVRT